MPDGGASWAALSGGMFKGAGRCITLHIARCHLQTLPPPASSSSALTFILSAYVYHKAWMQMLYTSLTRNPVHYLQRQCATLMDRAIF